MLKRAEHLIKTCDQCKGTGKIIGPKQVELTEEDRIRWHQAYKQMHRSSRWNGLLLLLTGLAGMIVAIISMLLALLDPEIFREYADIYSYLLLTSKTERYIFGGAMFALGIFICCLGISRFSYLKAMEPFWEKNKKILARYGVEKGEAYRIVNE